MACHYEPPAKLYTLIRKSNGAPLKVCGPCSPEQKPQLDSIVAKYEGNLPEVGLVDMHDSERCLSLCCLQAPPLPSLGRDSEHEERGDAPGTVAAPAGNGAGDAGASAAWTILGFGAFFY